ncbi:MAG: hypothetical protein NTV30_04365 [Chloroflexi bacterium]|nr:hypothetical protein [Chloroflexota bacterium]
MPQRLKWKKLRFGITAKILIAFLILSIVSLSVIGTLAYSSIKNIGSNSIDTSTPALENLARSNLYSLAIGQASESGILFEKVATQADELADYASTLWANKAQLLAGAPYNPPVQRSSDGSFNYTPDASMNGSICHVPAEINPDTVKDTIMLTSYMDDVFRSVMEKNSNVSWVYFGTVDGVFRVYPSSGGIPVGYKYKERPWYLKGAGLSKLDRGGWTNPYLDAGGKGYKITRSTPVFAKDGSRIGYNTNAEATYC